jgi:signal transduction histidine kinase
MGGMDRREWAFDLAVAGAVTGVELALLLDDGSAGAGALAATAVTGGAVALRRVAPLPVLAVALVAAIAIIAGGEAPSGISVLVALITVAARCERRTSLAALAATAIVVALLSVANADAGDRPASVVGGALAAALLAAGIWGLGAYVRAQRRLRAELEARAASLEREREQLARIAVQQERTAIARELHDIIAHSVGVMLLGVRGARHALTSAPDVADETLARVESSGEQSIAELRRMLTLLRDPGTGADWRPQPSLADLPGLLDEHRAAGLDVRLLVDGARPDLPDGVEVSVFRIVQEALTNARRHANARRVTIGLTYGPGSVDVEVEDDGAAPRRQDGRGHGLLGMRERVAMLGGELSTGAGREGGFRVAVRLPVAGAGR